MAVYSTNQNRQFYVVESVKTAAPTEEKAIFVNKDANGNVFFEHYGAGGLTRSDFINPNCILYAKATPATAMQHKMQYKDVTLSEEANGGEPIIGQDYVLRIVIHNFVSMSDLNTYIKFGVVHATKKNASTASDFYVTLALSLAKNFAREVAPMLKFQLLGGNTPEDVTATNVPADFSGTYTGVRIMEVEQDWRLGINEQQYVRFDVIPTTVLDEGVEVVWGEVEVGESEDEVIPNTHQIADLEYFCMGERGDQYRTIGWPNNFTTKYLVDATAEDGYDVLDIQFAFVGEGTHVQKSEKYITIVCPHKNSVMNALIAKINTAAGTSIATLA